MQSTKYYTCDDVTEALNRASARDILRKRSVRTPLII